MSARPPASALSSVSTVFGTGWPGRGEWLALAVIVLAGCALRAVHADHISVEHYDEGVYASNWFYQPPGEADPQYPKQYLFAPPLLPNLTFWWLFFSGGNPHSVVWINILAGTLTIPLFWWVGRSWFGLASGLLAAALCAFSDLHIALSRMVLTDVLLLLFLTAGVWTGVRAIQTGRPLWIVLGGLFAGLAWWTKYNGWLTLAITGAGLAGWVVFERPKEQPIGPLLFRWLATAVIAAVIWSPVVIGLQDAGGYSVVSANHSRYVVGFSGWWQTIQAQFDKLQHIESWLCLLLAGCGLLLGVLATSTASTPNTTRSGVVRGHRSDSVLAVAYTGCALAFRSWVAAWLLVGAIRQAQGCSLVAEQDSMDLGLRLRRWTMIAWFAGLAIATPLYAPYPRLVLPFVASLWLAAAWIWSWTSLPDCPPISLWTSRRWLPMAFMIAAVAGPGLFRGGHALDGPPRVAWQDRRGLEMMAAPLVAAAERDFAEQPAAGHQQMKAALYVFAEPGLFYHLVARPKRSEFRFFVQPLGDHALLSGANPHPELATYLIAGPHADAVASDAEAFAQAEQEGLLELVERFQYQPSDLVLLDDAVPQAWTEQLRNQSIRLYRRR